MNISTMENDPMASKLEKSLAAELYICANEEFQMCLRKGHYIYTDFLHYSMLVEKLVDKTKILLSEGDHILCFTGLCVPPFQWFNFDINGNNIRSFNDIQNCEANDNWTRYLKYWSSKSKGISIYRCLMHVDDNICSSDVRYRSFPSQSAVEFQLGESLDDSGKKQRINVIFKESQNGGISPLDNSELKLHLGKLIGPNKKYSCYNRSKKAFLIVDASDNIELKGAEYCSKDIQELLNSFQTAPLLHWDSTPGAVNPEREFVPDDFFFVGIGSKPEMVTWQFALVADVAPDYLGLMKVRLWFLSWNSPAKRRISPKLYADYFTMNEFQGLIDNYVIKLAGSWK